MKKILLSFIFILGLSFNLYAQNKPVIRNTASETAPVINPYLDGKDQNTVQNFGARFFGQDAGAVSFFTKGFLTNAATHTNFGPSTTSLFGAMEFDNNGVLYCIAMDANSPLQTLDTVTGVLTTLGPITGIILDYKKPLGMSFNVLTNTMYLSYSLDWSPDDYLYSLNLSTRVATYIGAIGENLFDIAINSTGQCYGITVNDNLVSINLTTAAVTVIGPIGFDGDFFSGVSFDRSTDTLWYAAYNTFAGGQLLTVNLTTGATTLVGPFNPPAPICGFAIRADNLVGISTGLTLIPETYSLEQNYPNPFNPTTSIRYSTIKSGLVTLKIYNVLGKEIATLINEIKPAGSYDVIFNASSIS
ncbi:MAG: DUF4394 domain-containing protein, partial [Bacteroidota bacterium]|nr:DUF4394 domain-containing protein [Bacteroidota bacterium]